MMSTKENALKDMEKLYKIEIITEREKQKVIEFLNKFIFKDGPILNALQISHLEAESIKKLEESVTKPLNEGLSLAAVLPNGHIIGISINRVISKNDESLKEESASEVEKGSRLSKSIRLMKTVDKESNVFGKFPQFQKLFDIQTLSVDDSYRGLGICRALIEKTIEIAKQNEFRLLKVDCSSHYSAKAASNLGFRVIYTLPYKDFKDENGVPYITPKLPHTCVQTLIMELF